MSELENQRTGGGGGELSRQAILYRLSVIKSEYNAAPRHVCLLNLNWENLFCSVFLSKRLEGFIFSYKMHHSLETSCQLCVSVVWCKTGTLQLVGLSELMSENSQLLLLKMRLEESGESELKQ